MVVPAKNKSVFTSTQDSEAKWHVSGSVTATSTAVSDAKCTTTRPLPSKFPKAALLTSTNTLILKAGKPRSPLETTTTALSSDVRETTTPLPSRYGTQEFAEDPPKARFAVAEWYEPAVGIDSGDVGENGIIAAIGLDAGNASVTDAADGFAGDGAPDTSREDTEVATDFQDLSVSMADADLARRTAEPEEMCRADSLSSTTTSGPTVKISHAPEEFTSAL